MRLSGNLAFGDVPVNTARSDGLLMIANEGNSTLTVTSIITPCPGTVSVMPNGGSVPAGGSLAIAVRFAPTSVVNCSGDITVAGDQTAGSTTSISMTAAGSVAILPLFVYRGLDAGTVTMPSYVTRVRIDISTSGSCQNFVMRVNGGSFLELILGTCAGAVRSPFSGTYTFPAGAELTTAGSTGVEWIVTEVR